MVREFQDAIVEIQDSADFAEFKKEFPGYYLAHGFIQLDQNFTAAKEWQIGFYLNPQALF